jgi:ABC-type Fe3+ transport system permease subunit
MSLRSPFAATRVGSELTALDDDREAARWVLLMLLTAVLIFLLAVAGLVTASAVLSRQAPQDQDSRRTRWLSIVVVIGSLVVLAAFLVLLGAVAVAITGNN